MGPKPKKSNRSSPNATSRNRHTVHIEDFRQSISFTGIIKMLVLKCITSARNRLVSLKWLKPNLRLLKRKKRFAGISLCLNFVIFLYIGSHFGIPSPNQLSDATRRRSVRFISSLSALSGSGSDKGCSKSIMFFGIRDHWLIFCSFPEFAHYKYLITFPREVHCPELSCSVTVNYTREAKDIQGYDMVVFTNVYEWLTPEAWGWVHGNRTSRQIWVMITEESPLYVPGVDPPKEHGNHTYNWFDSYKSDSDFVHPYGLYQPFDAGHKEPEVDLRRFLEGKDKLVAWMGSHCETLQWSRSTFVKDFGNLISVDKYGKCGDKEVPWNNDTAIFEVIGRYKFYLSLENSCCDEYITEKFWRALEMGLLPIVVGAPYEHYVKVAPPNSFIHVDEFESLSDLAIYLLKLNMDDEQYLSYFKWRHQGRLISYGQEEQYVRPLNNATQCSLLEKYMKTSAENSPPKTFDYYGKTWQGSCTKCGNRKWMDQYMLGEDSVRNNADIWA